MEPEAAARAFASDLRTELDASLIGATLFGSVARGEYVSGFSDVNVLVIVDDIEPALLARIAPLVRRHDAIGLNPLPMERREWVSARDVFGIEILDMRDAHVPLTGEDPIDGVEIARDTLRLQAERELRARLITWRSGLLRHSADAGMIGELLRRSVPSFVAYLRAALRLDGNGQVPRSSRETVSVGCTLIGADPAGMLAALDARSRSGAWKVSLGDSAVAAFNDAAEKTAVFVDRAQPSGEPT